MPSFLISSWTVHLIWVFVKVCQLRVSSFLIRSSNSLFCTCRNQCSLWALINHILYSTLIIMFISSLINLLSFSSLVFDIHRLRYILVITGLIFALYILILVFLIKSLILVISGLSSKFCFLLEDVRLFLLLFRFFTLI